MERRASWRSAVPARSLSPGATSQRHLVNKEGHHVTNGSPPATAAPPYAVVFGTCILIAIAISMIYLTVADGRNRKDFQWFSLPPETTQDYHQMFLGTRNFTHNSSGSAVVEDAPTQEGAKDLDWKAVLTNHDVGG
jgi:hypothetical protein